MNREELNNCIVQFDTYHFELYPQHHRRGAYREVTYNSRGQAYYSPNRVLNRLHVFTD